MSLAYISKYTFPEKFLSKASLTAKIFNGPILPISSNEKGSASYYCDIGLSDIERIIEDLNEEDIERAYKYAKFMYDFDKDTSKEDNKPSEQSENDQSNKTDNEQNTSPADSISKSIENGVNKEMSDKAIKVSIIDINISTVSPSP